MSWEQFCGFVERMSESMCFIAAKIGANFQVKHLKWVICWNALGSVRWWHVWNYVDGVLKMFWVLDTYERSGKHAKASPIIIQRSCDCWRLITLNIPFCLFSISLKLQLKTHDRTVHGLQRTLAKTARHAPTECYVCNLLQSFLKCVSVLRTSECFDCAQIGQCSTLSASLSCMQQRTKQKWENRYKRPRTQTSKRTNATHKYKKKKNQ